MTGAIIQARMSSTRLPGKVLLPLSGEPILVHVVERTEKAKGIDTVIVATTTEKEDDAIVELCEKKEYSYFRGSRDDVLSRYFEAAKEFKLETIVRITSDCPLIDPNIVSMLVAAFGVGAYDYMSNIVPGTRTFPRGLDCEIFSFAALEKANAEAHEPYEREHVTPYIHENKKGEFKIGPMLTAEEGYARPQFRLTLDYAEDYALFQYLFEQASADKVPVSDVLKYLDEHPEIAAINAEREKEYPSVGIRK